MFPHFLCERGCLSRPWVNSYCDNFALHWANWAKSETAAESSDQSHSDDVTFMSIGWKNPPSFLKPIIIIFFFKRRARALGKDGLGLTLTLARPARASPMTVERLLERAQCSRSYTALVAKASRELDLLRLIARFVVEEPRWYFDKLISRYLTHRTCSDFEELQRESQIHCENLKHAYFLPVIVIWSSLFVVGLWTFHSYLR